MSAKRILQLTVSLSVLCLMALHCTDPNLPRIKLVDPPQGSVIVQEGVPYALPVEVSVPLPGCGATTFPVDPDSFTAVLSQIRDGQTLYETDITSSFARSQDPQTQTWTWTASLELSSFGDYQIAFTIQNERGSGANTLGFRLEQAVAALPGGTYWMGISSLKQAPSNCLLPDVLLGVIYGLIKDVRFLLTLPSGQDILDSGNAYPLTIPLPYPLGNIDVLLSLDEAANDILIDGPDSYTIDLTGMVPPPFTGFDCVITASAEGIVDDLDPTDLDGALTIGVLDVQPSPGGSGCTLSPPSGSCNLKAGLDGDPM